MPGPCQGPPVRVASVGMAIRRSPLAPGADMPRPATEVPHGRCESAFHETISVGIEPARCVPKRLSMPKVMLVPTRGLPDRMRRLFGGLTPQPIRVTPGGRAPSAETFTSPARVRVFVVPSDALTVRLTVYAPIEAKLWLGLASVEVLPSPKSQDQPATGPVERSVKLTASGAVPDTGAAEKSARSGARPWPRSSHRNTPPVWNTKREPIARSTRPFPS